MGAGGVPRQRAVRPRQARPGDAQRAVGEARPAARTSCSTRCIRAGPTRLACNPRSRDFARSPGRCCARPNRAPTRSSGWLATSRPRQSSGGFWLDRRRAEIHRLAAHPPLGHGRTNGHASGPGASSTAASIRDDADDAGAAVRRRPDRDRRLGHRRADVCPCARPTPRRRVVRGRRSSRRSRQYGRRRRPAGRSARRRHGVHRAQRPHVPDTWSLCSSNSGVETIDTTMSFAVTDRDRVVADARADLPGIVAQQLVRRPSQRRAAGGLAHAARHRPLLHGPPTSSCACPDDSTTLGEMLAEGRYSSEFIDLHLIPLGSAVWSADPTTFVEFPARSLLTFLSNHGLLGLGQSSTMASGAGRQSHLCRRSRRSVRRIGSPVIGSRTRPAQRERRDRRDDRPAASGSIA